MTYLDNAATTRPHPKVLEKLPHLYGDHFGNPSSVHPAGTKAANLVSKARKIMANIFDVPQAGVIFCSSGTESDNLALKGFFQNRKQKRRHLITTRIEHAAISNTCAWLTEHENVKVDYVDLDSKSGMVDLEHLEALVCEDTGMISIQHINSETGIVQDLGAISKVAKGKNKEVILHSDGVQAFTRVPVNLNSMGVDLYSISAHKFHGIKGAGALVMRKNLPLQAIVHGGGQEQGLRSGTENTAAICAMGIAAEEAYLQFDQNSTRVKEFALQFKKRLKENFPTCKVFEAEHQIPHIISVSIPGILGEVLLHHLAEQGIYVSTGSACNASSKKLSSVLSALDFDAERIRETIRISMAAIEIPEQEEAFFEQFVSTVKSLQEML